MAEGSDVDIDLEEGELVSSGEEDTVTQETSVKEEKVKSTSPAPTPASTTHTVDNRSLTTQSSIEPVSDDGEIYSDSEESAYFPHQVKSRPPPKEKKSTPTRKRVSRWSDSYQSSPSKAKESDSPVRRRKRGRSNSSEKEEDREGSDDTSKNRRSSKEKRSSKERQYNSPSRSSDRHSSPDSKGSYYHQDRSGSRQKWSRRGGYGSSSPYQSQGRYGRNRGGGGHGNKRLQSHPPALSAQESHMLSLQIPKRLEEGLSLLPDPKYARHTRVDLSMYPPPPTWYLRELKAWDALHKPKLKPVQSVTSTPTVVVDPSAQPASSTLATAATDTSFPFSVTPPNPMVTPIPIPPPIVPIPIPLMGSLASADFTPQGPSSTLSNTVKTSETANENLSIAPLDPGMPFAEPLPSSHTLFAQPLVQPQAQPVTSATDAVETVPIQSFNPPSLTSDTGSSMNPLEVNVPSAEDSVTSGVEVRAVGEEEGGSLFGRSFSVSSEVNMEIDLRQSQSSDSNSTPLPTPSSPIFNPPSLSADQVTPPLIPTIPSSLTPTDTQSLVTTPLTPSTATPTLASATDNQQSVPDHPQLPNNETAKQVPEIKQSTDEASRQLKPPSDAPISISSSVVSSQVLPCNSVEEPESVNYNLRPRAGSGNLEDHEGSPEVADVSDEDIDYDTYLDQLDDEEIPVTPTLTSSIALTSLLSDGLPKIGAEGDGDLFSGDFPVINKESAPKLPSTGRESLMALVAGDVEEEKSENVTDSGSKSTKRKEKTLTWKAKQKQKKEASKEKPLEKQSRPLCKYFMNGNCKNGDKCSFSHEGPRNKRNEVCKFYKQDTCNKGQDCMYYHGEFPCKFYHIKQYCRNGDQCKFSHIPLNAESEVLLNTVADSLTSPSTTPVHTVPPLSQSLPIQGSVEDRVRISEEGVYVKMFGSTEQSKTNAAGLVVSIPKNVPEELMVSVPLTRITDKMMFGRIPKKKPQSTAPTSTQPPLWDASQNTAAPFPGTSLSDQMKGQSQNPPKRVLLPTPPPHAKLTPEDFKRMENSPHEYWEAPGLSEPHPQVPHPPHGPHWRPPPADGFRPQASYSPRPRQPFYRPRGSIPPRPPRPEQNWNKPPYPSHQGQNWNQPPHQEQNWNQPPGPSHPEPNWNKPPAPSHSEQNWNKPPGSSHSEQNWNKPPGPSHPEPNYNKPPGSSHSEQNWNQPPHPPPWPGSRTESGPENVNARPPGGWNQRPEPRPSINPSYPRSNEIDHRPRGMDPRHTGNDPRHPAHDPRFSNQNDPRNSPAQGSPHYGSGTNWPANADNKYLQSSPPYSGPYGTSPPLNNARPAQEWTDKVSPIWKPDPASSPWGTSPDHHSSNKGVVDVTSKRLDPRKKYSHLKIKSKNSSAESPNQSSLKRDGTESANPGYKIPKLLANSTDLDKPIDPKDLFGTDSIDSQPYGEITFGTYTSPFSSTSSSSKERTMTRSETGDQIEDAPSNVESGTDSITDRNSIPSYVAQIESGLSGGGLEIESAFGSLSEKNKESNTESGRSQESQARKLPSVFGFGL